MTAVIGREDGDGPVAQLGRYRARDGSAGARIALDVDRPHAVSVVGKRGYGKSYTLGVLAEELAGVSGVAPVVVDPLGVFGSLARAPDETVRARKVDAPTVSPSALGPRAWCSLVGLAPESAAGALVWQAAAAVETIEGMCEHVAASGADSTAVRAASNHLRMADEWGVFDPDGLDADAFDRGGVTVLDCSALGAGPTNAVGRVVAESLFRGRERGEIDRLPWLLVDEAQVLFDGVAGDALATLLTRGRAPGVSLAAATQRPDALPAVCLSQSDVILSHRLTAAADLAALERVEPSYLDGSLARRLPSAPGEVVVIDDTTESVHAARVRERQTPHGGDSPRSSQVRLDEN